MKKFIAATALAVAVLAGTSAHATIIGANGTDNSWGVHELAPSGELGQGAITTPDTVFTHYWLFTLGIAVNGIASAISNPIAISNTLIQGATNASVSLYIDNGITGAGGGDVLIAPSFTFGNASQGQQAYSDLSAGSYYYVVSGKTSGTAGGNYTVSSTMEEKNVPLPGTLGLVALPILALMLRKKKVVLQALVPLMAPGGKR